MAKYTLYNNLRYLDFTNIITNDIISISKENVREVQMTSPDPYLFIIHTDDVGDNRFRYDQVIDPSTGQVFTSLLSFKNFILESLNDLGAVSSAMLGTWNATTNLPTLGDLATYDSTGDFTPDTTAGTNQYFLVGVAGTTSLDGQAVWDVGDYVRSNGSVWVKVEAADTIPAATVIYDKNGQLTVEDALDDLYSSSLQLNDLSDVDAPTPNDLDELRWNSTSGKWEAATPTSGGGRTFLKLIGKADATVAAPMVDGYYLLHDSPNQPWVPVGAVAGDILQLLSAVWTIKIDVSTILEGSVEIQYDNPTNYPVNFVWDGIIWVAYNAYNPDNSLEDITISNPIGELSGYTGGQLRDISISWLFDTMLFTTIYTAPLEPTLSISSSTGNYERGFDISGTRAINFTQNGAGSVHDYSIEATESGILKATQNGAILPASIDLNNINGHNLIIPAIVNETAEAKVTANYDAGPIPEDNKGTQHPGDQILAGTLESTAIYTAKYPIWYGATSERFTINTGAESTTKPLVAPNDGSNSGGTLLTESWIRANLTDELFTTNISNRVDTIVNGTVHCLVACPPGIVVSKAEIFAAGSWIAWDDLETHSFTTIINAIGGGTPKTYTVHYVRSIAADNFSASQNFRFSTAGSIIP